MSAVEEGHEVRYPFELEAVVAAVDSQIQVLGEEIPRNASYQRQTSAQSSPIHGAQNNGRDTSILLG